MERLPYKTYADLAQRKKAGLSGAISSHYDLVQKPHLIINMCLAFNAQSSDKNPG